MKQVTRDADRRSDARAVALVVRMSRQEREALHRAAERRGTSVTALVLESVSEVLDEPDEPRAS